MEENTAKKMHFLNRSKTSWVYQVKGLFESTDDLIKELSLDKPTTRHSIKMFGKDVLIPRFQQAYGKSYSYSGTEAVSIPFTEALDEVKRIVMSVIEEDLEIDPILYSYNMCLVNWYDNGDHYISPHSDDERQLVPGSTIASVSLGATRKFLLAPKKGVDGIGDAVALKLDLEDGDLVIMGGTTQKTHVHSVPKDSKCESQRVNITFRVFV